MWFDDLLAVEGGMQSPDISLSDLAAVIARPDFVVRADLGAGDGSFSVYTCDCSQEYVRINSEYMT